jgi:threonylcarbamoyladenosine tRNA methylthiotransferase MtaB
MFANSLALVEDCDLVFGHVFPYSPREGTPAARMPQVPPAVAKTRAATLRDAIASRKAAWLKSLVGTTQQMLVELDGLTGHIANFAAITLDHAAMPKSILPVIITHTDGARLYGAPA